MTVGSAVGTTLGSAVGTIVGSTVGMVVGSTVGTTVGAGIGMVVGNGAGIDDAKLLALRSGSSLGPLSVSAMAMESATRSAALWETE